jgi:hypothetical protein
LSLGVKRTIDVREPANTQPGPYAREHRHEVRPDELLRGEDAIARIVAIENAHEDVVPSAFRTARKERPRDPALRMRMARCELESSDTIRRAAYDASVAYFLGAPQTEVYNLVTKSLYPDGTLETSCTGKADCGTNDRCDAVTKTCVSPRMIVASRASQVELDIEDILSRAYAARISKAQLQSDRYQEGDLAGTFAYGRLHKCGRALCTFSRLDSRSGETVLIHWDIRYHGSTTIIEGTDWMTDTEKRCYDATSSISLDQCKGRCDELGNDERAACELTCVTHCKREYHLP